MSSRQVGLALIDRLENLRERLSLPADARKITADEDTAYWRGKVLSGAGPLGSGSFFRPLQILDLGGGAGYGSLSLPVYLVTWAWGLYK